MEGSICQSHWGFLTLVLGNSQEEQQGVPGCKGGTYEETETEGSAEEEAGKAR